MENQLAAEKGEKHGSCNRTACQAPESAHYYNHSTKRWYCEQCAKTINLVNPESFPIYGHALCTHADSEETINALSK